MPTAPGVAHGVTNPPILGRSPPAEKIDIVISVGPAAGSGSQFGRPRSRDSPPDGDPREIDRGRWA